MNNIYNMIPLNKILNICSEYGIEEYVSISKILQGVLNDNYFLETTTGRYFVKSVREKAKNNLKTIYEVESFMKDRGVPAVTMLKTKSGEIFVSSEDDVYTLYTFIESDKSAKYLDDDYKKMGEMLAKIHLAGSQNFSGIFDLKQFKRPLDQIILERLAGYKDLIKIKNDNDEIDKKFLEYIDFKLNTISKIEPIELSNDTLIHGDYHPDNLLIDKKTREIVGVCDWEKAEFGPRSYELARSVIYSCFSDGYEIEQALLDSKFFFEGYLSVYPMKLEEIINGLKMRTYRMVLSSWIEEKYYKNNDDRANNFVQHEKGLIDEIVNNNLLKKIEAII